MVTVFLILEVTVYRLTKLGFDCLSLIIHGKKNSLSPSKTIPKAELYLTIN
ncbi:hypothetical protein RV06_GL002138 [Enterococcus haemoperoxidus]|nr:hypothetical protein RV06_GL002138 [Enterococcus haemoperoxidus]